MPILSSKGKSIKINNCKWENSGIIEITRSCLKLDFAPLLSFFLSTHQRGVRNIPQRSLLNVATLEIWGLVLQLHNICETKQSYVKKMNRNFVCGKLGLGTKLLTCLRPMSTSYRNQWHDLQRKLTAWFLYDRNTNL